MKELKCKYCQEENPSNFLDLMTATSDLEGDEFMDLWGVPLIKDNLLSVFYASAFYGDMNKKFKINYCPICGRKL